MLERSSLAENQAFKHATKSEQKLRLLKWLLPQKGFAQDCLALGLSLGGLPGTLMVSGPESECAEAFLRQYFSRFLASLNSSPQFVLHYEALAEELWDWNHELWHDSDHSFHLFPLAPSRLGVVQRDFIGALDTATNTFHVFGPKLCAESSDSLDNALQFLVNKILPEHHTLPLHAAVVEREGAAYVFYGDSGVGKSTLAALCASEGLRVLAGDQIYVGRGKSGQAVAMPSPITIAQLQRESYVWCTEARPVRAFVHLVQNRRGHEYRSFTPEQALAPFLRQITCRAELAPLEAILSLAIGFLGEKNVCLGEMSYPKGESFWSFLDQQWKRKT